MTAETSQGVRAAGPGIYFPGLNGIRAIAAMAVVASHTTQRLDEFGLDKFIFGIDADGSPKLVDLAGFGVTAFFALSGFLITYLLLKERESQSIDVKKFYVRRALRIWPLYYAYLAVAVGVALIGGHSIRPSTLAFYVFYGANIPFILHTTLPYLVHYWSLGVEEQFYLFWPWLARLSFPAFRTTILTLVVGVISTKSLLHFFVRGSLLEEIINVTEFHCMGIGALGACLYYERNGRALRIANHRLVQWCALGVFLLVAANRFHVASFVDHEFIAIVTVVFIFGQIERTCIFSLEHAAFDYIGRISYGIYVLHPLVILALSRVLRFQSSTIPAYLLIYAAVSACAIGAAHLSFEVFEKKFLRMKGRFTVVSSSSTRDPSGAA